MVGAILARNVSWTNTAQAVTNLKDAGMLDPELLPAVDASDIAHLLVPPRFYTRKTERLQEFARVYAREYQADPAEIAAAETGFLRERLLAIKGIRKETDSILLYTCGKPIFVVDAYTRRIFSRYGLLPEGTSYGQMQRLFLENLEEDIALFNDYHAQIVRLGNTICRKSPLCDRCPVR